MFEQSQLCFVGLGTRLGVGENFGFSCCYVYEAAVLFVHNALKREDCAVLVFGEDGV